MPLWLILALSAAAFWAFGQVFAKQGFKHIPPLWNNIFTIFSDVVVWIPAVLILSNFSIKTPNFQTFIFIILTAVSYMVFYYAISKGQVSLTGSLWSMYPIATVILSYIFLNERITFFQTIGIISAILGAILIILPEKSLPKSILKDKSWIYWGLIGSSISGTGDFFAKIAIIHISSYSVIFFTALILPFLGLANFFIDKKGRKLPSFSLNRFFPSFLAAFFASAGLLVFLIALNFGKASLVTPASSITPAIMVILAVVFLKEKINKRQILGICSIVSGIILLGSEV